MAYQVGDNVEFQPESGSSRNVRILEVLERDCYIIRVDGNRVMIHDSDILGLNFKTK